MLDPIFFFSGGKESEWGFLSNFYDHSFTAPDPARWLPHGYPAEIPSSEDSIPTQHFFHSEQYLMYCKALQFSDRVAATNILGRKTPRKCKGLGRSVKGFVEEEWILIREKIMDEALWWKFGGGTRELGASRLSNLGEKLLATGERELVEASPFDRVWGIGFGAEYAADNREDWGLNLLGESLMRTRKRLKEQEARLRQSEDSV